MGMVLHIQLSTNSKTYCVGRWPIGKITIVTVVTILLLRLMPYKRGAGYRGALHTA